MNSDKLVGRPIRLNQKRLVVNNNEASVIFLGDVHYGSKQFDAKRFRAMLHYCLANNIYLMLMGDLLEVGTKGSVGAGVFEQECPAGTQHEVMIEWLKPLATHGLILGTHRGNHGERVYKDTGFDIDKALARELGISFLSDACWSQFKVGKETYNIYSLHGRTGARFDGTALLAIERISTSFFADMVAMGHAHKAVNSIVLMQKIANGCVVEHKKHLLITGSYLKYDGGYAQTVGLPISKLGSPKVRFFADRHDLVVSW